MSLHSTFKSMKEKVFLTVVGTNHYYGNTIFKIDEYVTLKKEPENPYDSDAIAVVSDKYGVCGYIANSANTILRGTKRASRIYDHIGDTYKAKIVYSSFDNVILEIEINE